MPMNYCLNCKKETSHRYLTKDGKMLECRECGKFNRRGHTFDEVFEYPKGGLW